MKNFILLFLVFLVQNIFSQESYTFDYYTVYEFEKTPDNSYKSRINFSNSKNLNYQLFINISPDGNNYASLNDIKNKVTYNFNNISLKDIENGNMLTVSNSYKLGIESYKKRNDFYYSIEYYRNDSIKTIHIKQFRNKKKSRLESEAFYETKPTDITKFQHYNLLSLAFPLWYERFKINNDELITKITFIDKKGNMYINKLKEIKKIDFKITIVTTNNTTN